MNRKVPSFSRLSLNESPSPPTCESGSGRSRFSSEERSESAVPRGQENIVSERLLPFFILNEPLLSINKPSNNPRNHNPREQASKKESKFSLFFRSSHRVVGLASIYLGEGASPIHGKE